MTILLLSLLSWVVVSFAIGGLWMLGHRPRPERLEAFAAPEPARFEQARAS